MFKLFLCFFSGLILSFISFKILPMTFSLIGVYLSTFFILLSITFLSLYESRLRSANIYNTFIVVALLTVGINFLVEIHGVIVSLCGGILLYASSANITESRNGNFLIHIASILGILVGILIRF